MSHLKGKIAVVTGASKGIGAGIAKDLAAHGASVVVNYSSSKEGADTIRNGALRRCASRAAHSTACIDSSEPSTPTTTGIVAMTPSSPVHGRVYSWLPTSTARSARREV